MTVAKPFGCFYLMRLVERSIQVGAPFSSKLFVPKQIWQQDRVKLAAVPLKIEVFQELKQRLEKTSVRAAPATAAWFRRLIRWSLLCVCKCLCVC